ncbi:hypothetical protein EVAR_97194_1 [Eumeta japonica]|uniref:Uncharacterized protein n=1 Tax=Eumeta variegata TaxID=151549 RepID=A0A4C1WGI7_EUMVA|nr:hypothetical protein EVAR_97194_1 [Eumeta japonica]
MKYTLRSGLHRRSFISTSDNDDMNIDSIGLVSPVRQFPRFNANLRVKYKPKIRIKLIIGLLITLIALAAIGGYYIGVSQVRRPTGEPPDPLVAPPPSPSVLHVFQKAAVCTDAPQCSDIGSGKQRTKKEVSEHTNHFDPSGHSRKIVKKLMNTENNKKAAPAPAKN